jgi:hypothetical protein
MYQALLTTSWRHVSYVQVSVFVCWDGYATEQAYGGAGMFGSYTQATKDWSFMYMSRLHLSRETSVHWGKMAQNSTSKVTGGSHIAGLYVVVRKVEGGSTLAHKRTLEKIPHPVGILCRCRHQYV